MTTELETFFAKAAANSNLFRYSGGMKCPVTKTPSAILLLSGVYGLTTSVLLEPESSEYMLITTNFKVGQVYKLSELSVVFRANVIDGILASL